MTVERIVRPFQNTDVFRARVLPPVIDPDPNDNPQDNVVITITSKADTEYFEEPPPTALGFNADWVEDRSRRVIDTVRVENPDDPEQFVEVERIKTMVIKNTTTGDEIPIKPDWT